MEELNVTVKDGVSNLDVRTGAAAPIRETQDLII